MLQPNRPQIIGRGASCDIVIDKAQISARHVRLLFDGRRLEAEDLGSTNGTFANGSKITRSVLNAGDVLQLTADPAVARFSVGAPAAGGAVASSGAVLEPLSAGLPSIALQANRSISIGRSAGNDVVINRQQISGCHCRISMDGSGNVSVEDCQSTNGTYIDDLFARITRVPLRAGQIVYLANRDTAYKLTTR